MAAYTQELSVYRGEQKTWRVTVTANGSAKDISSSDIRFVVRATVPGGGVVNDSSVVFAKTVGSGITITNGIGGICEIQVDTGDTYSLSPSASTPLRYFYGLEMDGVVVLAQGPFIINYDVVRGL